MHRSSSRRDLRSERLGQSPYSRKEKSAAKRPAANQTFSPLSSIVSFVSNAFGRGRANDDDKSVSGSEDGWDGEPPESMNGQDVFSLASAAGRGGSAFEERAETWRAEKGLLTKSARRGFPNSKSNWGMLDLDAEHKIRPSPSMPALPSLRSAEKAPVSGPSSKTHLRPFVTPSANRAQDRVHTQERVPSSASSAALRAFVAAKGAEPFEPQDVEVMDSLMRGVRAEASVPDLRSLGGWSAATYASTPQRNTHATPVRQQRSPVVGTPGSAFSLGSNTPLPSRSTPQRKTYLGPGMSPRRIFGRPVPVHKPLFGGMDDTANKKRRVEDTEAIDIDEPASSASSPAPSIDTPAAAAAAAFNAKARQLSRSIRPSPLSQLNSSPEREEEVRAARAGKKRADDLLRSVIDDELGPEEPEKPKIVINPYEETTPHVPAPSGKVVPSRSSLRKSSSSMKLSTRGSSVTRGAAEKIERLKGSSRKLTTLELVSGYKPTPEPTPTPMDEDEADDIIEVEPVKAAPVFTSALKPAPKSPPKSRPALPEPPAFKPFAPPTLSSSTLGSSTASPKRKAPERTESAAVESIVAASKRPAAPVFNPTPIGLGPAPLATASLVPQRPPAPRATSKHVDPTHMFLSAKDSALNVDKVSLPFFTFTLPSSAKGGPSDAVKTKVKAVPIEVFDFSMRKPSLPSAFLSPTSPAATLPTASDDAEWTCNLCMLKNPGSAKDKCTICEAPKQPAAKKAAPPAPSSFAFKPAAPAAGEWTCDTCMLKNPASATDKCTICEARKPGAKAAAPAAVPSVFKPAPAPAGEWTCDTCMLKNPASATDKCTVCEARKPGAVAAAPAPAAFTPAPAASEWTCDTCMLKNPASATEKCTICDAPKPGASASAAPKPPSAPSAPFGFGARTKPPAPPAGGFSFGAKSAAAPPAAPSGGFSFGSSSSSGFKPPAPPTGGFSFGQSSTPAFGFKPAAAPPTGGFTFGAPAAPTAPFKPSGAQGEWTCDTCMLKNPDSAKEKCTVCEAARPK